MTPQNAARPPKWFPASVFDGPSVRVETAVRKGDEVMVGLSPAGQNGALRAVVRWCTPEPDGRFRVELALHRQLTRADLLDLGR